MPDEGSTARIVTIASARMWIEQQASIHLKAATRTGDPLELTADQARAVADALRRLADDLDRYDAKE